ncbi:hypothetical protein A6A40_15635 (plasmid) [Azospirillum humicireducens]|uniref:Uncharacterized protein n=1 Tax=Azospirillum humicireducens TaxID=1226968 RepID=A0A2R4VQ03_9PROT|nr:DUF6502 family protein [Azospirillum humicireducens]AWB06523.1 hypothetical protein A6A40_15635 [Azospirillum humicireducens]
MPTRNPESDSPKGGGSSGATPPPAVLTAVRRVLVPLVRTLIGFGISWPMLANLLKSVYVEVAERGFALPGKPMTDSRITLLTGVHRKDVSQIRNAPPPAEAAAAAAPSFGSQVLSRWLTEAAFRDADGRPRPLPRNAPSDGGASFETLVTGISKDIRPRALLDELLHAGLVVERPDGLLELDTAAHVPRGDLDKLAYYYGRNLADHLAASGHNLAGGMPPFLERALAYDRLCPDSIAALRREADRLGMAMLVELNRMAADLADGDADREDANHRFTAGLYLYDEAEPPAPALKAADSGGETAPP